MVKRTIELAGLRKAYLPTLNFPPLGTKNGLRVMFVPSDNSASSGAFRSMVTLVHLLRNDYNIDAFVVLPNEGSGTVLVNQASIPSCIVPSSHWTMPMDVNLKKWRMAKSIARQIYNNHFAIQRLRRIIRQCQVDLVHVNTTWTYVGAVAARLEKTPYVWHLREFLEEDQGRTMWSRPIGNALISQANASIAISSAMKKKYLSIVPQGKLIEILNGIDDSLFRVTRKVIFRETPYTFVMVGNFRQHKGHIEFSKACVELYKTGFRDFQIWFVGTGDNDIQFSCMKEFERAGMSDIVTYWGFQEHPEKFLLQADVAFMCSRAEAFGRVTVESMMSGCLVIGAATAATVELIMDGKTGLLYSYEQGNVSSIVEKMKVALSKTERMREIAMAGREFAFASFTARRNAEEVAALYSKILQ